MTDIPKQTLSHSPPLKKESSSTSYKFWRQSTTSFLLIGYIGYYLCRGNLSGAFPLLSAEFHLSNSQLGLIAFYSEIVYTFGKFINGPLVDKFGGKKFFLVGMLGAIMANILFTYSRELIGFIAIWCGCRFFLSMGWAALVSITAKWYRPDRFGRAMGFLSLSYLLGGILATLLTGYLVQQGANWKEIFMVPAAILAMIMVLCSIFIKESPVGLKNSSSSALKSPSSTTSISMLTSVKMLLQKRVFIYLLIFSFLTTFMRSVFLIWIPKMLVDLGQESSQAIFQSTYFPLLGALSTYLLGVYTDKKLNQMGRGIVMAWMLVGLVICLLFVAGIIVFFPTYVGYFAWPIGLCGFFLLGPYSMAGGCLSLDIGGKELSGSCSGFVDGIGYVGGTLALWMVGIGSDLWGWDKVMLLLAFFAGLTVYSAYLLGKCFDHETQVGAIT